MGDSLAVPRATPREVDATPGEAPLQRKTGIVLSGGGARGAYQAGVLRFLLGDLAPRLCSAPRIDFLCGSSVGALNASWLACGGATAECAEALARLWRGLRLEDVYRFRLLDLVRGPMLFSKRRARMGHLSLLDASPMRALVEQRFDWAGLRRHMDRGTFEAVAVSATEAATGRNVQFIDHHRGEIPGFVPYPSTHVHLAPIGPAHCLASAAIPVFFPPIEIEGHFYLDGSLRQNTPVTPAIRLGAERVLVIGVKRPFQVQRDHALSKALSAPPSLPFLLGKALNALMLDAVEYDLHRVEMLNALFEWGERTYDLEFMTRLNESLAPLRGAHYRKVETELVRPREDLGRVAADTFRTARIECSRATRYLLSALAGEEERREADLLSYLFFDKAYTAELVRLGWEDARDQEGALARFFE